MKLHSLILFCASVASVFGNDIKANIRDVVYEEGSDLTIFCNHYPGTGDYIHWYRQYDGSKPEFLVLIYGTANKAEISKVDPRFSVKVEKKARNHADLKISSAAVSDSAVYYCALQPTGVKIIFGRGTRLIVESKTEVKPNIYKVGNSCLATDFTKHNEFNISGSPFHKTSAVRYSGQSYYSSFKFSSYDCEETGICSSSSGGTDLERDEKVNFLSLGIFWLRILFLKTVVFNVLVTFKAWMS